MDAAGADRVIQRLLASWEARDLEGLVDCLSDDVEWYDPAMPDPPARGRAAVRAWAEAVIRAFPDFRYEVLPPICHATDGSRCAIKWRITASHLGFLEPPGYAPTGRRAQFEGVDLLEFQGERVRRILTRCRRPSNCWACVFARREAHGGGSLRCECNGFLLGWRASSDDAAEQADAAPGRQPEVPPCAPAGRMDGGTASQLIRSVRPTSQEHRDKEGSSARYEHRPERHHV
jgi:ketosteroid isomerase-like protein